MFDRILLIFAILMFHVAATAQAPTPTPASPRPGNPGQGGVSPILEDNSRYDRLRSIELISGRNKANDTHPLLDPKTGIYRRPGKDEISVLAVDASLQARYASFLREPNGGIVKLNADSTCASNAEVLVATDNCLNYQMPGAGTAYSFRTESYRLPRLADLILQDGIFKADGVFQHAIFVDLGDVAIQDVSMRTNGVAYLANLKPAPDGESFLAFDRELVRGIEADGFRYRKGFAANNETTFALRSIAFKGTYLRSVDGITYNELDYDRRRDVIVTFRVVDSDGSGNLTLVWKKLRDTGSPTLRIRK